VQSESLLPRSQYHATGPCAEPDQSTAHPQTLGFKINFRFISNGTSKQDRQCTYNVTLRRVRVTIVAVEKQ
jgi:hypothetical protein